MPEEGQGVNGAGSPSAQQGVNSEGSPNSQQGVNGAGSPTADQQVPYERFREVNERMRQAEARAAANEALARQLATQHNDLAQRLNQQQQQNAQPTVDPEVQALETVVSQNLGSDATGQQARQTLEALIQLNVKKALKGVNTGGVTKDEIAQIVQRTVSQAMAPQTINGTLQQWRQNNRISEADVPIVAQEMQEMIAAEPSWGQGENANLLPIVALGNAVAKGRLKPAQAAIQTGPNGTPLQPGGASTGEADDRDTASIAEAAIARFPALAKRNAGDLAKKWSKQEFDPHHGETIFSGRR